jgi:hypothetical protein
LNDKPSSVTSSSTDFSFQNLVFWNLFEFSAAEITLKSSHQDPSNNTNIVKYERHFIQMAEGLQVIRERVLQLLKETSV